MWNGSSYCFAFDFRLWPIGATAGFRCSIPDGKFVTKWTEVGQLGLAYYGKENCLYMRDGKNDRVVKLNLDGRVSGVLGSCGKTPGRFDFAHNMAVDSTGATYVAEIENWRVQKFAPR